MAVRRGTDSGSLTDCPGVLREEYFHDNDRFDTQEGYQAQICPNPQFEGRMTMTGNYCGNAPDVLVVFTDEPLSREQLADKLYEQIEDWAF